MVLQLMMLFSVIRPNLSNNDDIFGIEQNRQQFETNLYLSSQYLENLYRILQIVRLCNQQNCLVI